MINPVYIYLLFDSVLEKPMKNSGLQSFIDQVRPYRLNRCASVKALFLCFYERLTYIYIYIYIYVYLFSKRGGTLSGGVGAGLNLRRPVRKHGQGYPPNPNLYVYIYIYNTIC